MLSSRSSCLQNVHRLIARRLRAVYGNEKPVGEIFSLRKPLRGFDTLKHIEILNAKLMFCNEKQGEAISHLNDVEKARGSWSVGSLSEGRNERD